MAAAVATFGSLDLLVNNTGINPVYGPLMELDLDAARKIVEVNAVAALGWVQAAHRAWLGVHGGAVVNVASVAGVRPAPGIDLYGASKAMLDPADRVARRRARPRRPRQRRRPRGREDPVRDRALRGPRGGGGRGVPAEAARRRPRTSPPPSPSCSPRRPSGPPGRRSSLDGGVTLTGGT